MCRNRKREREREQTQQFSDELLSFGLDPNPSNKKGFNDVCAFLAMSTHLVSFVGTFLWDPRSRNLGPTCFIHHQHKGPVLRWACNTRLVEHNYNHYATMEIKWTHTRCSAAAIESMLVG